MYQMSFGDCEYASKRKRTRRETFLAEMEQVNEAEYLLHGKESVVHADAGYIGADKRAARKGLERQIARKRGSVKAPPEGREKRAI